ncbi:MAG: hypothetical protein M1814_004594 [Vezdaea aestivalis]|nr:MAG: hypothetical protein M1814_004594 [Vezdaea aestivalis]
MPFRERMRKVLGRDVDGVQKTKSKSENAGNDFPKPKYGNRMNPEHQAKLKSYDIGNAFSALRRKSMARSDVSPGNSRRSSAIAPEGRKSIGRTPLAAATLPDGRREDENVDPMQKPSGSIPQPITEESSPKSASIHKTEMEKSNGVSDQSQSIDGNELAKKLSATKLGPSELKAPNSISHAPAITVTGS